MKTAKELTQEVGKVRARAKELSGFWISELAAAMYALEWAAGKRDRPPSADIGSAGGEHGKIADRLLHAVSAAPPARPRRIPEPPASKGADRRSERKQLPASRAGDRSTKKGRSTAR